MKTTIKQFTDAYVLTISSDKDFTEPLVDLVQAAGSMRFQFSMRPDQAREMARALLAHADHAESFLKERKAEERRIADQQNYLRATSQAYDFPKDFNTVENRL